MKNRSFLLLGLLSITLTLGATTRTVSNNASTPGQFNNLQTAINTSAAGDTIYVQGSPTNYGSITVNKRITIMGNGYWPDSTDYNLASMIGVITFDTTFTDPIRGSKFVGLSADYMYFASGDRGLIYNMTFERCYFGGHSYIAGNNWVFLNCIFNSGMDINDYDNLLISNSMFFNFYFYNSDKSTVNVLNSIFLNYTSTMFNNVQNMAVYNNLFWNNTVDGCSNCLFMNNITWDDVARDLPGAGNSGTGNKNNIDPKFVSTLPLPTNTIPNSNLKSYDWHLQATSPGHNAGTDGTDVGVYGGSYPNVNLSGMNPQLPVIRSFIIKNPVAQKNGTLQITIKANKIQ